MPHMTNDERREQLIDAATKVIREEGLAKATTRRIADAAGAPLGSLHYCFRGKEDLLAEVTRRLGSGGHELAERRVTPGMGVAAAAALALESFAEFLAQPEEKTLSEYEIYIWANMHDEYQEMPAEVYRGWASRIQAILKSAERDDEPARDTYAIARLVLALVDGYNLQGQLLGEDALMAYSKQIGGVISRAIANGEFDVKAKSAATARSSRARKKVSNSR
jgi:TetR/AcrR family transcriptional regulator, regulator of biofilm formation and stress response